MEVLGIACRVIVGAVLIVAAVSKLRDRTWGVLAMENGTPRSIVTSLPAIEGLLGLALVLQVGGGWSSWVAVALLAAFTVVVVNRFRTGSQTPCNCFGANGSADPVTAVTIARNLVLLTVSIGGALL